MMAEVLRGTSSTGLYDLPVEILHHLSLSLDSASVRSGIFAASAYLRDVFSDEVYWKLRCKRQYPTRWQELTDLETEPDATDRPKWRKVLLRHDRKVQCFSNNRFTTRTLTPWTTYNQHNHFWSTGCVTFCDSGKLLATAGDSPDVVSLWRVNDSNGPSCPFDQAVLHKNKVASLRSSGRFLSSASWDKTIAISDLHAGLVRTPLLVLKTKASIATHEWSGSQIVTGSEDNDGCEMFDIRSTCCAIREIAFSSAPRTTNRTVYYGQPIKPKFLGDDKLLLLGYEHGTPVIKLYDIRAQSYFTDMQIRPIDLLPEMDRDSVNPLVAIPDMHIDENILSYTAGRQFLQYNCTTLDLVANHSGLIAEDDSVKTVHRANGVLLAVTDRRYKDDPLLNSAFCVSAYTGSSRLEKLWEKTFPVVGQKKVAVDFSEQACALAIAMDEKTFLLSDIKATA